MIFIHSAPRSSSRKNLISSSSGRTSVLSLQTDLGMSVVSVYSILIAVASEKAWLYLHETYLLVTARVFSSPPHNCMRPTTSFRLYVLKAGL